MGRPSTYTQKIADLVCERLAEGESLKAICRDEGLSESTVRLWALDDAGPGFAARYARARELGVHARAESIQEDYELPPERTLQGNVDAGWVAMQRLKIDAKKWEASKMLPKVYGDKLELAGNADSPLTVVVRKLGSDGS